jgi:hypothetical protein
MAVICGIFGMSGDGKTTSTIINPDGTYEFTKDGYKGMNPSSHFIINLDRKTLPFPAGMWAKEKGNYLETSEIADIRACIQHCAKTLTIKSISFDTINLYLAHKEYNSRQRMTYDQWADLAQDLLEINTLCNTLLRPDQIAYIMGHVELMTDVDGVEKKVLAVSGKKSKKQMPEGFYPLVLMTRIECDGMGGNKFFFQTKAQNSTAKTPIGMFADFEIPNSLRLVDDTIRKYYNI